MSKIFKIPEKEASEFLEGVDRYAVYHNGFADGLKEGARRERRALKRWLDREIPEDATYWRWINKWLAARSKAKPTREGK